MADTVDYDLHIPHDRINELWNTASPLIADMLTDPDTLTGLHHDDLPILAALVQLSSTLLATACVRNNTTPDQVKRMYERMYDKLQVRDLLQNTPYGK